MILIIRNLSMISKNTLDLWKTLITNTVYSRNGRVHEEGGVDGC